MSDIDLTTAFGLERVKDGLPGMPTASVEATHPKELHSGTIVPPGELATPEKHRQFNCAETFRSILPSTGERSLQRAPGWLPNHWSWC